jgi:hypothetical protein
LWLRARLLPGLHKGRQIRLLPGQSVHHHALALDNLGERIQTVHDAHRLHQQRQLRTWWQRRQRGPAADDPSWCAMTAPDAAPPGPNEPFEIGRTLDPGQHQHPLRAEDVQALMPKEIG